MARSTDQVLTEWLVLQAQSGRADALDQLIKLWYPKLLRYAAAQTRNWDAAKDVVQETLLSVSRRIRLLDDPAAFPKWMYRILERRTVDYLRREERSRRNERAASTTDAPRAPGEPGPGNRLEDALESLARDSYQVVHLRYIIGLSVRDIARVIGVPEGTVKSRLHSARAQLRILLTE